MAISCCKRQTHNNNQLSIKSIVTTTTLLTLLTLETIHANRVKRHIEQDILLDTTEQSSLGWTHYPDGGPGGQGRTPGWSEESFLQMERDINWRSFVTCDVAYTSVNNWLWTPYLERGDANRLYIEIKFTMRDCSLFPQQVLSCKETFALLYKEVDGPNMNGGALAANLSFAQSDSYTLIDAIAADEGRFTSNTDVVINTEIRSVPVSKRGVYFAFRDQGACLSLISIKVYSLKCAQLTTNLAHFNATLTGRDLTSLVAVEGECVANSIQVEQPRMFCAADGQWNTMSAGQCKCAAGFEPVANRTECRPCAPGRYKALAGDSHCLPCPDKSYTTPQAFGSTECKCFDGYFRASRDSRSSPCTQPPGGAPQNLTSIQLDSTSVTLQWSAPKLTGGRDDLTYKLECDSCDLQAYNSLVSSPQMFNNFSETKCVLAGLQPQTSYRFLVYALNGVTMQAIQYRAQQQTNQVASLNNNHQQYYSEIIIQTSKPVQQSAQNTLSSQNGGFQLLPVYNFRALVGVRGTDMLLAWDVAAAGTANSEFVTTTTNNNNGDSPITTEQLSSAAAATTLPSLYEIKYQMRIDSQALSLARRSPYPILLNTNSDNSNSLQQQQQQVVNTITTTSTAVGIYSLQPRSEYAFQIRAKWPHSNTWTDWSEPTFARTADNYQVSLNSYGGGGATTTGVVAPQPNNYLFMPFVTKTAYESSSNTQDSYLQQPVVPFDPRTRPFNVLFGAGSGANSSPQNGISVPQSGSWLSSFFVILFCSLLISILLAIALIHYKRSVCLKALSGTMLNGMTSASSSAAYAGVYNGGTSSDLMSGVGGGASTLYGGGGLHTTSNGLIYHNASAAMALAANQRHHLHTTIGGGAGSAGALITGSNSTSRSSSGAGNVVQNFIAATLSQFTSSASSAASSNGSSSATTNHHQGASSKTLQHEKLFFNSNGSGPNNLNSHQHQQHLLNNGAGETHQVATSQRNHYHQMLGNVNHTLFLNAHNNHHHQHHFQQQQATTQHLPIVPTTSTTTSQATSTATQSNAAVQQQVADLFGGGGGANTTTLVSHQQQSKYGNSRTLSAAGQYLVQDPHIYDDLDVVSQSATTTRQSSNCSPPVMMAAQQQQQTNNSSTSHHQLQHSHANHHSQTMTNTNLSMIAHSNNMAATRHLHDSISATQQQQQQQQQVVASAGGEHTRQTAIYARELYDPPKSNNSLGVIGQQQQQQQQRRRQQQTTNNSNRLQALYGAHDQGEQTFYDE